jgi:thioredoxin reductase (NADPH)
VTSYDSAASLLDALSDSAAAGRKAAIVIAPVWLDGVDLLAAVRPLHPTAKRLLAIPVGDVGSQPVIRRALTLNQIDYFFGVPWASPEEELYPTVGEALRVWAVEHLPRHEKAVLIDRDEHGPGYQLWARLQRTPATTSFITADSPRAEELLREQNLSADRLPVIVFWDGRVLVEPDWAEICEAMGKPTRPDARTYDVAVVGGGPAGVAAAAYAAAEGLTVLLIEPFAIGGQAATTSKIRNYLGFRWGVSGKEFGARVEAHAEDLGADFVVARHASAIRADGDKRIVTLDNGDEVVARSVVVATGVTYRQTGVAEIDRLVGSGVFYGAAVSEARSMGGLDVFVLGGGNSAGQATCHLAGAGAQVTVLVRGDSLAPRMTDYLIREIGALPNVTVRLGTRVVGASSPNRLETLVLEDSNGTETVKADALFVFIGARPQTAWLSDTVELDVDGYVLTGGDLPDGAWPLERPPTFLETSMPGVFAAGDIRHRSKKRVAAAVGEGSTALLLVQDYLGN